MNNNVCAEREFAWDDVIENDSTFELIPDGEYEFTVKSFTRGRHSGSQKLPACNKAILTLSVKTEKGERELTHNLFLHSKTEGILCAFFACIGQRKHGEQLRMDWNRVQGAKGKCKIGTRKWKGNDGTEKSSNEILKFIEPKQECDAPVTSYTVGIF